MLLQRLTDVTKLHADFQSGESVPCIADTLPHPPPHTPSVNNKKNKKKLLELD